MPLSASRLMTLVLLLSASGLFADNVVTNGTFDSSSAWAVNNGSFVRRSGPGGGYPVLDTQPYFQGGGAPLSQISQVYDLTAQELAALSGVGLGYQMSGDLFGFGPQGDFSTISAEFFDGPDATGSSLGAVSLTSTTGDPGSWPDPLTAGISPSFQQTSGMLPSSTESIRFSVRGDRVGGTSNDGYADNFVFDIQAVPEPGSAAILGGLAMGMLGMRRRR